jgi:hypothetical protein
LYIELLTHALPSFSFFFTTLVPFSSTAGHRVATRADVLGQLNRNLAAAAAATKQVHTDEELEVNTRLCRGDPRSRRSSSQFLTPQTSGFTSVSADKITLLYLKHHMGTQWEHSSTNRCVPTRDHAQRQLKPIPRDVHNMAEYEHIALLFLLLHVAPMCTLAAHLPSRL